MGSKGECGGTDSREGEDSTGDGGQADPRMEGAAPGEGRRTDPRHEGGSTGGWRTDRPSGWRGQHRGEMEGGPWDGVARQVRARRVRGWGKRVPPRT